MVMATFSISAVARKAQATANGSTTQFAFSFSVNTEADVAVFVGTTLKTISTHYTVSITASTGAGSITFTSGNTPSNGQIVTIMSKTALARSSVYTSGGTINATSLETDFDTNMMLFQQQDERLDRTLIAPVDDATSIDMTLPNKDARKGTVLGFNATSGNPEAGPSITAVQSLADVTTAINLLGTSDAVSDMNTLGTSSNVTNQNTLAGISGNITTVAGIASDVTAVAGDATDIGVVAGKATEIGRLGTSDAVADMALLGTSAVVEDMGLLGTAAVVEDMGLLANSTTIANMAQLGTSAAVADMAILGTSDVVADMAILATTDVVADMNTLATSDIISDLNTLATSDIVTDMNLLATSSNVAAMALLGTSDVVADMALLGTSDVVADMAILGTTDVVSDMNTLATSDIVSDMNTLATSANVTAMGLLGTSAVVEDMGFLGTAAVVEDMGILGTSANVTAMSNVSGSISNVNTVATNLSGITAFSAVYSSGSSDPSSNLNAGDLFFNTSSDTLKVYTGSAWEQGVTAGSGFLPLSGGQLSGNLTMAGSQTVDGRDLSADGSKLDGIAASANNYVHPNHSGEVTSSADGATVVASNVIDADNLKVTGNGSTSQFLRSDGDGTFTWATPTDTNTEYSVGDGGLTQNNFTNTLKSKLDGIEASATADQTASEIRTLVESASDSNVFTDADHTKLNGVAASANNYVHPNHSGEVTSTADGATVIADNVVDEANLKVSNSPVNGYMLTAQSGNTGGLTWAAAGGGALELIATLTASNSGTLDFTGFDASTYSNYQFYFQSIKPNTEYITLRALASTDGGSNYATSDYQGGSTSNIFVNNTSTLGDHNASSGILYVYDPADTTGYTTFVSHVARNHGGSSSILIGGSCVTHYKQKTAINAIRFYPSSGNFTSGRILCYGIKI